MAAVSENNDEAISLNIMPMLDIFSILVTFLLMSFSTDPVNHDLHKGVELPQSNTLASLEEVPELAVTPTEILLNDKKITDVVDGDVIESARNQGAIQPLFTELEQLKESYDRIREAKGKAPKTGNLTLEMHKKHNFKLMKRVMLTGQQAEFVSFKLAVQKEMN